MIIYLRLILSSGVANLLTGYECQNNIGFLWHLVQDQRVVSVLTLPKKRKIVRVYNFKHDYCCIWMVIFIKFNITNTFFNWRKQSIFPLVTYGAETWNLSKTLTVRLWSMLRAHEWIMRNVAWTDHKTSQKLRRKTTVRDIKNKQPGLATVQESQTTAGHRVSQWGFPEIVYETADDKI